MSDKQLDNAVNAIREWHYSEIRSMADSLIADCNEHFKDDDFDDFERREWMTERVDEDTDTHNHVIYTFKAKCVLLASDNEDAYPNEIGERGAVESEACMAMRADLWELLNARRDEWLEPREADEE